MSNAAMAHLDLDRAEELARKLATAVTARRIYAPDHSRVQTALREFLGRMRDALEEHPRLRLATTGGTLTHEGVPLESGQAAQLAQLFAERDHGGLVLRPEIADATVAQLVDWLSGRRAPALRPRGDGLELLDPGAGEELHDERKSRPIEQFPEFKVPKKVLELSTEVVGHIMADARLGRSVDFTEISQLTRMVAEATRADGIQVFAATQLARDNPESFDHAINVFLIATAMLQPFARDPRELELFSQAALLHDIGKSCLPEEILLRESELTEAEAGHLKKHPEYGAKILAQLPHADPLAVEVAYCHHMREDGHGYPTPIMPIKPGPVTNLVQAGDLFESVSEQRSPQQWLGAQQAVNRILETPGLESRQEVLALMLHRLTDAPPGCEVRLESGERGIVVEVFPDAPNHPRVRMVCDREGHPIREPHVVDLREAGADTKPIVEVKLKPGNG